MKIVLPHVSTMPNCLKVEKFCCCLCTLKSGTLFIGVVYTLLSLMTVSTIFTYEPSFENEATHGLFGYEFGKYGIEPLLLLSKISAVIWFVVNLSLLYGTLSDRSTFITPWIGWHLVLLFLQIIIAIWAANILEDQVETYVIELTTLIIAVLLNTGFTLYFIVVVDSFRQILPQQLSERVKEYSRLNASYTRVLLFFWITVNSYYIFLREEEDSLLRLLTTRFQVPIPVQNGRIFRDPGPNEQSFAAEYTPKPWATQESSPNVLRPWSNPEPSEHNRTIPKPLSVQEPSDETAPYQRPLPIRRPLINAMNQKSGNMRQLPQKVLPPLPPKIPNASPKPKLKPRGIPDPELWISQDDSSGHTPSPKPWEKEEIAPEEIPYREPWVRKQSQEETPYREPWIDESGEEIAYEKTWKSQSSEYDNAYQETWSSQESAAEDVRWKPSEEDASYDQLWTSRLSPTEDGYFDPQSVVKLPLQTDC